MPVAFSWHHDETEQTKQDQGRLHFEKKPQKIFEQLSLKKQLF